MIVLQYADHRGRGDIHCQFASRAPRARDKCLDIGHANYLIDNIVEAEGTRADRVAEIAVTQPMIEPRPPRRKQKAVSAPPASRSARPFGHNNDRRRQ